MTAQYLISKTLVVLLTLAVLLVLQFAIFRLMPGDPTATVLSGGMTLEVQQELERLWGLDKPLKEQFLLYAKNIARLDFGVSFFKNEPVREILKDRFWNTIVFMAVAMLWANTVGISLGVLSVAFRNRLVDSLSLLAGSLARSTPLFVTGILLLIVFAHEWNWFPTGGMHAIGAVYGSPRERFLNLDFLHHLILPTLVAGLFYFTTPFFIMRAAMLEYVGSSQAALARAKGMSRSGVLIRHMARNALNPVITSVALSLGFSIGGQVVVETLFRWPGMGSELVFSTLRHDYPVMQGIFFFISITVIFLNYLTDLLYLVLDPRVRYSGRE